MMTTWRSFRCAFAGVRTLLATQSNARVHLAITAAVVVLGWSLRVSRYEWCWLIAAATGVWTAEAFNTAVEILGDEASGGAANPLVGRAKDVAAGAVLLAAMGAAVIGVIIFLPRLLDTTCGDRVR
jgi:diacylglycerol kinase (ATP)